jgi:transketolase
MSPDRVGDKSRDRFILSKGHGCASLYAVLADRGYFPREWLFEYGRQLSPLPNHPCKHALPQLESSSGSLGQGLGIATGMLTALRLENVGARAVVLMGDGECNEGSVWESAMFAAANRLTNLIAIVDYNGIQAVGRSDELMGHTSLEEKFRAFGWSARTVNGNRVPEVLAALNAHPSDDGKPFAIIAKTRGGAGVGFMENDVLWHYRIPSDDDLQEALRLLNAQPIHMEAR